MICENCGIEHDGNYGSGRFCSTKCSRSFATKGKRKEINEKVSKSLKKDNKVTKNCEYCDSEFTTPYYKRHKKYCSNSCSSKSRWLVKDYKEKMSKIASEKAIERHKRNDSNFGWQTRNQIEPSYPESIAIRWFEENNISFEREVKFGKYFIDFAIGNIAIEIDGQQHELEERKESDKRKDNLLIENGWKVYRIKFSKDNIRERLTEILGSTLPT